MAKNRLLYDPGVDGCEVHRLAIWLDQVNGNPTVPRPQHAGLDFDHAGEIGRIANRSDALAMPGKHPQVLGSLEGFVQRLPFFRQPELTVEALGMHRTVEVIT